MKFSILSFLNSFIGGIITWLTSMSFMAIGILHIIVGIFSAIEMVTINISTNILFTVGISLFLIGCLIFKCVWCNICLKRY